MNKKDIKLYFSLIGWTLVPSIYLLVRMNIIAINNVNINILGQIEWFDLIDETIVTVLTVPLYYLLKPEKTNPNKNGFVFIASFLVYLLFTVFIICYITQITAYMGSTNAVEYLTLESISLLIGFISTFIIMILTLNDEHKIIKATIIFKVVCLVVADCVLICLYKENGAAISEAAVNILVGIYLLMLCIKRGYIGFNKFEIVSLKEWIRIGAFSGMQILLDNIIYAIMICKMVNAVNESGNYWVANNFIWGWLLVPVSCLGEIIRKNDLKKLNFKNSFGWGLLIFGFWITTIPFWNMFVRKGMMIQEENVMKIVYFVMPFYITYIPSVIFDSWFISKGKTYCNFIISLIVNIVYYGMMYLMFKLNMFEVSIGFIIILFGLGMIVHMIIDIILYLYVVKNDIK